MPIVQEINSDVSKLIVGKLFLFLWKSFIFGLLCTGRKHQKYYHYTPRIFLCAYWAGFGREPDDSSARSCQKTILWWTNLCRFFPPSYLSQGILFDRCITCSFHHWPFLITLIFCRCKECRMYERSGRSSTASFTIFAIAKPVIWTPKICDASSTNCSF